MVKLEDIDVSALKEIGLTSNEVSVYLAVLGLREATSGQIVKETEISSSRVYAALEALVEEGLVTFITKNNIKYFRAEPPEVLQENIEEKKKRIKELIPILKKLPVVEAEKEYTTIFEGFRGFKSALTEIVDAASAKDELCVIGYSSQAYRFETLRSFLSRINVTRAKKRVHLKILLPADAKETIGKDSEAQPHTTVKYMPPGYISPAAINILNDIVLIPVWGERPSVFFIKNKIVADSFRQYFDVLWQIAK
jgi:sugar-specific transcriptional regulator TrmB